MGSLILAAGMWLTAAGRTAAADSASTPQTVRLPYGWRPLIWSPPISRATPAALGLRVGIDPVTRTIGTPASEARPTAIESDVAPIRLDVRADGSVRSFVGDRMMSYSVVDVSAGVPRWSCLDSHAASDSAVFRPLDLRMPAPGTRWVLK